MLSFSHSGLDYAKKDGRPVHLEMSPTIDNCCMTFRDSPSVRFGVPRLPERYQERIIDGITVYVPHDLPEIPLVITLSSFIGFKKLVIEGWQLA